MKSQQAEGTYKETSKVVPACTTIPGLVPRAGLADYIHSVPTANKDDAGLGSSEEDYESEGESDEEPTPSRNPRP